LGGQITRTNVHDKPGTAEYTAAKRIKNQSIYTPKMFNNLNFLPGDENIKSLVDSTRIATPHDSST